MIPQNDGCRFQINVGRRCRKKIDPVLGGPFCCRDHEDSYIPARQAKYSSDYKERHPSAKPFRNEFDRINAILSQQGNFPFLVRLWWRVELPHKARQQFKNITALLPDAGYARKFAQDIQNHLQLSRKPRVKADYAIVLNASSSKESICSALSQLGCELPPELEETLSRGEQPLFSGHVVFLKDREDRKALLAAYRALLKAPERHLEEVVLQIQT